MNNSEKYLDIGIDIEQCRKEHNLPKLRPAVRQCLRCGGQFDSDGCHNRLCYLCKIDFRTIPTAVVEIHYNKYRSPLRRWLELKKRLKHKESVSCSTS